MHLFLTGHIQVGKSTLIHHVLSRLPAVTVGGFRTISVRDLPDGSASVYIIGATENEPPVGEENRVGIRPAKPVPNQKGPLAFPERFDSYGCRLLKHAEDNALILMDEIGKMERNAASFLNRVRALLDQDTPILGVVREEGSTPIQEFIRNHPKVRLVHVTEENRNLLKEDLFRMVRHEILKRIPSAGAFVLRDGAPEIEVLMVLTKKGYSFPKGHLEAGETPEEAACREVSEETGIRIRICGKDKWEAASGLPEETRTITYYSAVPIGGTLTPQLSEVRDAVWVPVSKAAELLCFAEDRKAFLRAVSEIIQTPAHHTDRR